MENETTNGNILKGYSMLLFFAGSMVMHEPSEECVVDFWKNGILNKLPVRSANPNFMKAAAQLRESCEDKKICGKLLRDDFIRLFGRTDLPLAPAYESLYENDLLKMAVNRSAVGDFYKSYGWESKFKGKINDDHLGIELLFLTLLAEKYLDLDDSACRKEMRNEIRRYISTHILSWIPDWNRKVQDNANTMCYRGIATLIVACAEDVYALLGQPETSVNEKDLKN
jgi:TorA maturation chaperone TorD